MSENSYTHLVFLESIFSALKYTAWVCESARVYEEPFSMKSKVGIAILESSCVVVRIM
jgi:hypothetical protein